jgi:predicted RNA-binding Zn ribbon-like protein
MSLDEFTLLGDALWLDFVNTARGRSPSPPDLLPDTGAFARWCRLLHLEPESEPIPISAVRGLRDRLTALAEALHAGLQAPAAAIAALNDQLARSTGTHQLTRVAGEWRLRFAPGRTPSALEAIARSAAATHTEPRTAVRRCAGEECSLFFADDTPTGSRRWCVPEICGRDVRVERRRGLRR